MALAALLVLGATVSFVSIAPKAFEHRAAAIQAKAAAPAVEFSDTASAPGAIATDAEKLDVRLAVRATAPASGALSERRDAYYYRSPESPPAPAAAADALDSAAVSRGASAVPVAGAKAEGLTTLSRRAKLGETTRGLSVASGSSTRGFTPPDPAIRLHAGAGNVRVTREAEVAQRRQWRRQGWRRRQRRWQGWRHRHRRRLWRHRRRTDLLWGSHPHRLVPAPEDSRWVPRCRVKNSMNACRGSSQPSLTASRRSWPQVLHRRQTWTVRIAANHSGDPRQRGKIGPRRRRFTPTRTPAGCPGRGGKAWKRRAVVCCIAKRRLPISPTKTAFKRSSKPVKRLRASSKTHSRPWPRIRSRPFRSTSTRPAIRNIRRFLNQNMLPPEGRRPHRGAAQLLPLSRRPAAGFQRRSVRRPRRGRRLPLELPSTGWRGSASPPGRSTSRSGRPATSSSWSTSPARWTQPNKLPLVQWGLSAAGRAARRERPRRHGRLRGALGPGACRRPHASTRPR